MEHCILNIAAEFIAKFSNTFYMYMVTIDFLYTFGVWRNKFIY